MVELDVAFGKNCARVSVLTPITIVSFSKMARARPTVAEENKRWSPDSGDTRVACGARWFRCQYKPTCKKWASRIAEVAISKGQLAVATNRQDCSRSWLSTAAESGVSPAYWNVARNHELARSEKLKNHEPRTIQIDSARAATSSSALRATRPSSRACRRRRSVGRSVRESLVSSNSAMRKTLGISGTGRHWS